VLGGLGKKSEITHLPQVIRTANKNGLAIVGYFMIGNPGETQGQAMRSARFASEQPFAFVQFTKTFPLPNTKLYDRHKELTGKDMWLDFYKTGLLAKTESHVDCNLKPDWVSRFINRSYLRYYLHPRAIYRVVSYFGPLRMTKLLGVAFQMLLGWMKKS
jgi:radical SAM superfamily enzyme YgiQ (UPF0313 family)